MALEKGGRSDKEGNTYENFFLGKQLLRLVEGQHRSVEVEPLGEEGQGVEYIVTRTDNTRIYYQCKASNAAKTDWTISDLAKHKVFENAKKHILRSPNNEFHFISPLPCSSLNDLCERARKNHSVSDFMAYQVTNEALRKAFNGCEEQFNLYRDKPDELEQLVFILSKCYFEQVIKTYEGKQDVEDRVRWIFTGDSTMVRMALENYANDQSRYGVELSAHEIIDFLRQRGFALRDYGHEEHVWKRIQTLNEAHWEAYTPIKGTLLPRAAADSAIDSLMSNTSIILHGRAGSGKSGCVEIVSNYLRENHILFLRLKLDKSIPENSSVQYGHDLGLPDSPVRCLQKMAGRQKCVLILDQLDSLRWTTTHSPTALSVCKELISEIEVANRYHGANISVMFVTRSFDYRCDARIKSLFAENTNESKKWKEIEVGLLSNEDVSEIVGSRYSALSVKLKELLRTPSSLYVWMQLDEDRHKQVITSAHQLLHEWWKQTLERCEQKSINTYEMDQFAHDIAERMSSRSIFVLPRRSLSAHERLIKELVSEGLLTDDPNKVTFVHQTFLDYFVINRYLDQIADGRAITDIIGDRDAQTPNLRYRFLVLLQELCEYDECLFLEQCQILMHSNNVRHYYKCAVIDAAAQQTKPSEDFCEFFEQFWFDTSFHEYVRQVLYLGNFPLIKHLLASKKVESLSDEGIWMLRSLNEKYPDYLVDVLMPYCFHDTETDKKIYSCLCFDVDDDSDAMYQLRLDLFKHTPSLLENTWTNYYRLFKNESTRAVDFMLHILDSRDVISLGNMHFPDQKVLKAYAKKNCRLLVEKLLPKLFEATAGMASDALKRWYHGDYSRWSAEDYNESALRKIVQITKMAVCEYAEKHPDAFISEIVCEEHAKALTGNEIILVAMMRLPVTSADFVINWLCDSFPQHLFDHTGSKKDSLAVAKSLLEKFTAHCTQATFEKVESCIVQWSEPAATMIDTFEYRVKCQKTYPVYYAYWGFMQKELLPAMDQKRLSNAAKELLAVLNRNEWIQVPHYRNSFSVGEAKWVTSPIEKYVHRISDKTWLNIVRTPVEKMSSHRWTETKSPYIEEATPMQFASSMGRQAKKQPIRFARLSLQFPNDCYASYIAHVLRAQRQSTEEIPCADVELTSELIRRFSQMDNDEVLGVIADIIQERATEPWPEDILQTIKAIALRPLKKEGDSNSSDEQEKSAHSLYNHVLNRTQGQAIRAITSLLFENHAHFNIYRDAITTLSAVSEPYILLALVDCATACYNIDPKYAIDLFKKLVAADVQVMISHYTWQLICRDFQNDPVFYRQSLINGIESGVVDLGKHTASLLCAVAVYCDDAESLDYLLNATFTNEQANSICRQAASCFAYDEHREVSKQIIVNMANKHSTDFHALGPDFFKKHIVIARDKQFLLELVQANSGDSMLYALSRYLSETDENIVDFAEVIHAVTKHSAEFKDNGLVRVGVDELVQCVAHLYDVGKDKPHVKTICLDAWDELYKNNLRDIQPLSIMLDNFS